MAQFVGASKPNINFFKILGYLFVSDVINVVNTSLGGVKKTT